MRVLIVNTSEQTGGAAVAANRLMKALNNNGVKTLMVVRDKDTDDPNVVSLKNNLFTRWRFLWERWCIFLHLRFNRRHLFDLDIANTGHDITRLPAFRKADVIHLHWVNQGFLSLSDLRKILESGKPVVWTMHDMWPATGICHLTLDCQNYRKSCRNCAYLPAHGSASDLSAKVWRRKRDLLKQYNVFFVACSRWLEGEAKRSGLLSGQKVTSIPNPIDMHLFAPGDKHEARQQFGLPQDKRLILFVAQRTTNPNKGMNYLAEACKILSEDDSFNRQDIGLVVLGGHSEELKELFPYPVYSLGYISQAQTIAQVYRSADVFVLPSLSENLPNTIMEAMSCGVPCVGFRIGGIPEEIDHGKNGYVAAYKDASDLARGIRWVLREADTEALSHSAIQKVSRQYSQSSVARRYQEVYEEAMAYKRFKL